jgi:hypothetical protein
MSDKLVKKDVRYLNKDFAQFRQNLINFAKNYYPNTYQDFNESSPGMMFIEMASYVGDVLSYYTDQSYRETLLSSVQEQGNALQLAQLFGYSPKLGTPANVKLDVYQLVPAIGSGDDARPDYRYALSIQDEMIVTGDHGIQFRTVDPIDFSQDTAEYPTDISVYEIDTSGNVQYYLLRKQVTAVSGQVLTEDYPFGDPKPYDKIVLPDDNILEIVDIVDSNGNKWYEVDYLAQDTIMEDIANIPYNDPDTAEYKSTVPYILKLKRTPRRFVTRLRDDGKTELQFGSGISSDADEEIVPNPTNVGAGLDYLARTTNSNVDPTNFLYTSTYGLAPQNLTLTVRYTIGGSVNDNVGINTLTSIVEKNLGDVLIDPAINLSDTEATLAVNNPIPATGGRSKETVEDIRQSAMASFAAQNRCITREDYLARVYAMPGKYGSVAKAYIIGDSQIDMTDKDYPRERVSNPLALNLYTLGYDTNGNLAPLNEALKQNLRTYLSQFRMLTDAINIKTAFIVNIGVEFEVIPRPNENSNEVLLKCVRKIKELLSSERMQINGPINLSQITSQLDLVQGVQSITDFRLVNKTNVHGDYSQHAYDIEGATRHNILYPSLDPCVFEVKFPSLDIKGKILKP